jgi:predicted kinase
VFHDAASAAAAVAAMAFGPVSPAASYSVTRTLPDGRDGVIAVTGAELVASVDNALRTGCDQDYWAKVAAGGRSLATAAGITARASVAPALAFTGPQGSGKTTLAKLAEKHRGLVRFSWADPVRALMALGYDPDVLDPAKYNDVKERFYDVRTRAGIRRLRGREILQVLGTEAVRDLVDKSFWTRAGARLLASAPAGVFFVNDDTRFPNEGDLMRKAGFVIVRCDASEAVRRARIKTFNNPDHPSETGYLQIEPDLVINTETSAEHAWSDLLAGIARIGQARGGKR